MTAREQPARRGTRSERLIVAALLAVFLLGGVALRVDHAHRRIPFNDDYGTAALMSKHICEGREYPLYYYGYGYISSLGAYVGAGAFALFGASFASLAIAMIPFWALWLWIVFVLFRRLVGVWAGVVAAALVAFPSFELFHWTSLPLLGYPPMLVFGTLMLYFGVRLHERDLTPRAEWVCVMGMAVAAGLAIWTHPLSASFHLAALVLLGVHVVRSRFRARLLLKLAVASVLLIVTLLPVLITAGNRGAGELFGHWPFEIRFAPRIARATAIDYIPSLLLGREHMPGGLNWLVGSIYAVLGALFLGGAAYGLIKRRAIGRAATGRAAAARRATLVPLLYAVAFLALFVANPMAGVYRARYLAPFYVCIVACFTFPFALRRRWVSVAAGVLAALVVVYNVVSTIGLNRGDYSRVLAKSNARFVQLVEQVEHEGLRYVLVEDIGTQTLTFLAGERVVFTSTLQERYYPYAVGAAADDQIGFLKRDSIAPHLADTFAALGIGASQFETLPFPELGVTLFYNLELPAGRLRLVEPETAQLVHSNGRIDEAGGLIDRRDETVVGARFDADGALVVDFGRPVELAAMRLVAPRPEDYPAAYTLWGSLDDATWDEIQRVEDREPMACLYGNRLYYRGRAAVMECRFEPATVRLVKITDLRTQAEHHQVRRYPYRVWRFNEAFFYGLDESEPTEGSRPDQEEAHTIARTLRELGARFVIADEWLSRKIDLLDDAHLRVWPRWELRHPRTHTPRDVHIEPGLAIVVETAHADAVERRLDDATLGDVSVRCHDFRHYTAFVIENAPAEYAAFPGLRWNGFTLVGTARIATADFYHRRGAQLERTGNSEAAMRYYRRSYETFPGIRANLERLADENDAAHATLASLTPEHEAHVRFPHGVSLVGYTLMPSALTPGQPATLRLVWQLEGTVKHDFMQVFVHFRSGKARLFQADHNAVFPVEAGSSVPPALVLDEFAFTVPDNVPAGELTIHLGATSVADRSVRLKPRTTLPTAGRAVEIGRVRIAR